MKSIHSARRLPVRDGSMACSPCDISAVLSVQALRKHVHPHVCFLWILVLENQNLRHLHTLTYMRACYHGKAMYWIIHCHDSFFNWFPYNNINLGYVRSNFEHRPMFQKPKVTHSLGNWICFQTQINMSEVLLIWPLDTQNSNGDPISGCLQQEFQWLPD